MHRRQKLRVALATLVCCRTAGFFCLGVNTLIFSYLLAADPELYIALTREDALVESLTVVWLLLASLVMLAVTRRERSTRLSWVWLAGCIAMLLGVGQLINQGDPLLEPTAFSGLFNDRYRTAVLFLCIASLATHFRRKATVGGVPLPSMLLVSGFLTMLAYRPAGNIPDLAGFMVFQEKGLILLLICYALLAGRTRLFTAAAATAALVLAMSYANHLSQLDERSLLELREYLFGMACLFYALEIWRTRGGLRAAGESTSSGGKLPVRRGLYRLRASALALMVGSLGLVPFAAHFNARATPADEAAAEASLAGVIMGWSTFDVYLNERRLIYTRQPCRPGDVGGVFFLHLHLVNEEDLTEDRRELGFDNLDFHFNDHSRFVGTRCIAVVPLPGYRIAHIFTGQFIPNRGQQWKMDFALDSSGGATDADAP